MPLLIEFDNFHYSQRILLLVLAGYPTLLQQLLPLLWQTRELARGGIESDMCKMHRIVGGANLWPFGLVQELRHEA
jgi:hypothetical protein